MLKRTMMICSRYNRIICLNYSTLSQQTILVNNLKIKSIEVILQERANFHVKKIFQTNEYNKIFQFGIHPMQFRLGLLVYFKYGYWQTNEFMFEKLKKFIGKCTQEMQKLVQKQQQKDFDLQDMKKRKMILEYRHYLSIQLLPGFVYQHQYCNIYLEQLILYLEETKRLKRQLEDIDVYCILKNIEKILFKNSGEYFNNQKDNAWLISHAFNLFLYFYLQRVDQLPTNYKSIVLLIAKTLRVNHLLFLQYIKKDIQKEKRQINLQYFIATFTYLSLHNSFPYQYFYKVKDDLMNFIQSAQNLSEKKVTVALYMLEIFSRRQLVYCQKIISRLINCLKNNLIACDITQITRIFYHYSRLKYSPDKQFILKLVERITLFMDVLDEKHYALIIRSITNLNYQNEAFVQKLKDYNYELFLTQLKYGCQKLGEYYKAILNEIQINFQQRTNQNVKNQAEYQQELFKKDLERQNQAQFGLSKSIQQHSNQNRQN